MPIYQDADVLNGDVIAEDEAEENVTELVCDVLDGESDGLWNFEAEIFNVSGGLMYCPVKLNSPALAIAAHANSYGQPGGGDLWPAPGDYPPWVYAGGRLVMKGCIYVRSGAERRVYAECQELEGQRYIQHVYAYMTGDKTSPITRVAVVGSAAGGIGTGSWFQLLRARR